MEAFIPKNIEDNGGVLGGFFKMRNTIEAGCVVGFIFLLFRYVLTSFSVLLRLIAGVSIASVLGFLFLAGINNQPISVAILDYVNFIRTRCVVALRKPMPDHFAADNGQKRKIKIKIKKRKRRK